MTPRTPTPVQADAGTAQPSVLISRVRWLTHLRWLYAAVAAALGLLVWAGLSSILKPWPDGVGLLALAAAIVVHNALVLGYLGRLGRSRQADDLRPRLLRSTGAQISLDLVMLAGVLHFAGGGQNPLAGLLVFHVAVAASLLPISQAYLQAALGGLLLGLLALTGRQPVGLPWSLAISVVLLVTLLLTVYFTGAILSRLRNINRRLTDANRQLSALDLTKSRFLRVSSHQLRGPLAAIHAMLSAMEAAGGLNDRQGDLAGRIRERAAEIMKQLDEMMLLSTIQESTVETSERKAVEVGKVLAEAMARFGEEAAGNQVRLVSCGEGPLYAWAWEDAVETICVHLLGNAVKYTPAGGQVSASCQRRGNFVELAVADTGIGIPAEQKERVFGEFFRATNARQIAGGTGLGLAIVKAIVERLGGQIQLESALGQGTTVKVLLPLADVPAAVEAAQPAPQPHGQHDEAILQSTTQASDTGGQCAPPR